LLEVLLEQVELALEVAHARVGLGHLAVEHELHGRARGRAVGVQRRLGAIEGGAGVRIELEPLDDGEVGVHVRVELGQFRARFLDHGAIAVVGADDGAQHHGADAVVHHVHQGHVAHGGQLLAPDVLQFAREARLALERDEERRADSDHHDGDQ